MNYFFFIIRHLLADVGRAGHHVNTAFGHVISSWLLLYHPRRPR